MRLAERLCSGHRVHHGGGVVGRMAPETIDTLMTSPRCVVDDVSTWYWQNDRPTWSLDVDFGPMRSPFPSMWVEWRIPEDIRIDGAWEKDTAYLAGGMVFDLPTPDGSGLASLAGVREEGDLNWPAGTSAVTVLTGVHIAAPTGIVVLPCTWFVAVSDSGRFLQHFRLGDPDYATDDQSCLHVAFLAVSLMHCRNVAKEHAPARRLNNAQRRRGDVRLSYDVIHLPNVSGSRSTGSPEAGAAQALHLVRGHFKTYTEDKPLFGKRTGTYWWGWHARGDEQAGIAVRDFTVSTQGVHRGW